MQGRPNRANLQKGLLNGRIDPAQAESVMELINSENEYGRKIRVSS